MKVSRDEVGRAGLRFSSIDTLDIELELNEALLKKQNFAKHFGKELPI